MILSADTGALRADVELSGWQPLTLRLLANANVPILYQAFGEETHVADTHKGKYAFIEGSAASAQARSIRLSN